MRRYLTLILSGIIILLAAALAGVLIFIKNQPAQPRALEPVVEIARQEPDSSKFSWLERDPRQKILFAGYPFSKDYNDDRGHMNALVDVRGTARLNLKPGDPKETHATCYSCKSSNNPGLWSEMGMEAYDAMFFS